MPSGFRAVVFDYFGTLTVQATTAARQEGSRHVAKKLGVDPDLFFQHMFASFTERATGSCGDMEATMAWVANRCGHRPTAEQVSAACAERLSVDGGFAKLLRNDAVGTLKNLKAAGLMLGVVSDCTHELPVCWPELPIASIVDAVVFSVSVGKRKPHPSLYLAACERLDVSPSEVLYVGDGGSHELTGAETVGMTAIRLVAGDSGDGIVYDAEPDWRGPVVHSLGEVVGLVRPGQ